MTRVCIHCIDIIPKNQGNVLYCQKCINQDLKRECNCPEHHYKEHKSLQFAKAQPNYYFEEMPLQLQDSVG